MAKKLVDYRKIRAQKHVLNLKKQEAEYKLGELSKRIHILSNKMVTLTLSINKHLDEVH